MIDESVGRRIISILAQECGADEAALVGYGFLDYLAKDVGFPYEWRFMGALGFGGKFKADARGGRWRVDCYAEDATPERLAMIERANARLDQLLFDVERRLER